jgi:hypothetical protein
MPRIVLVLLLACLASWSAAAGPAAEPDPIVARINAWAIRQSDLARLSESLPQKEPRGGDPQRAGYLMHAVQEEVLFQWAVGPRAPVDRALREKLRAVTFQHLLETRIRPRVRVSGAEIAAYYEENLDRVRGAHVRARRIFRAKAKECEPLRAQTGSDEAFADVARRLSQDRATAAEGGDLGPVFPTPGPLGFERELFTMRAGETRVFRDGKGCSLVRVVERIDPPIPSLDEVRDSLRTFLETRREEQLLSDLVAEARKTVKVRLFLKHADGAPAARHPRSR